LKFYCSFSVWILLPILSVIIGIGVPLYKRKLYRLAWSLVVEVIGQIALLIMFNPKLSRINSGFPFHSVTDMDNSFFPRQPKVSEKYHSDDDLEDKTKLVSVSSTLDKIKSLNDKGLAVNITDIYADIKELGLTLSSHIGGMQITMRKFQILLEDWDVEADEGDQAYKND